MKTSDTRLSRWYDKEGPGGTNLFQGAIRNGNSFALSVCPTPKGDFKVVITPAIPDLASQVEVTTRKFRSFLVRHTLRVAVEEGFGFSNLLVSPVTEEEVRDLAEREFSALPSASLQARLGKTFVRLGKKFPLLRKICQKI